MWAGAQNAPVVFLCQNNQWAISARLETQTRVPLSRRASGFGFPGVRVDGNDVFACLAVTRAALERARAGEGPTLIEAFTYRMSAHTSSDDPTRYRENAELEEWRLKDPIERVRAYLTKNELAGDDFFESVDAEADGARPAGPPRLPGAARPGASGDLRACIRQRSRAVRRGVRRVHVLPRGFRTLRSHRFRSPHWTHTRVTCLGCAFLDIRGDRPGRTRPEPRNPEEDR